MSNSDGSSDVCSSDLRHEEEREQPPGQQERRCREADQVQIEMEQAPQGGLSPDRDVRAIPPVCCGIHGLLRRLGNVDLIVRRSSEERRVGKECVSTCTSCWSTYH